MKVSLLLLLTITVKVSADRENTVCSIPGELDGVCRVFKDCEALFSLFQANPASRVNINLIKSRSCGRNSDGKPLVCCSRTDEENTTIATTTTAKSNSRLGGGDSCQTPKNERGTCTLFRNCDVLSHINNKSSRAEIRLLNESVCSRSGGKYYVCCPRALPIDNNPCKDYDQKDGTCVPLKNCEKLYSIFRKKPISEDGLFKIRQSFCASQGGKHYVCCSSELIEETTITSPTLVKHKSEPTPNEDSITLPAWLESLKTKLGDVSCEYLEDFVFGGSKTKLDQYPWTVLLECSKPDNTTELFCGGSLINQRYVLTAGHCVRGLSDGHKLENVRLGEWNTDTDLDCSPDDKSFCTKHVTMKVSNEIIHPKFRNAHSYHNDIALIRLAEPVEYSRFIRPICLPLDPSLWTTDFTGKYFDIAGWGRTETSDRSSTKLRAEIPFVPHEECKKVYGRQGINIIDTQICAGGESGIDTCNGDSGGPLMKYNTVEDRAYWYLAGIVSFGGKDCGAFKVPGVYTKVSSFLEWIEKNID